MAVTVYYALANFHFFGQDYTAGQTIDVSGWSEHGIEQLIATGNVSVQAPFTTGDETDPIAVPEIVTETTRAETAESAESTARASADTALGLASASTQTGASYTFVLGDAGTTVEGNSATAQTFTVPPNSSVAFAIGTVIEVFQYGAGQITLAPGAGVTIRSPGGMLRTAAQYGSVTLRKRATDEWVCEGDLA